MKINMVEQNELRIALHHALIGQHAHTYAHTYIHIHTYTCTYIPTHAYIHPLLSMSATQGYNS